MSRVSRNYDNNDYKQEYKKIRKKTKKEKNVFRRIIIWLLIIVFICIGSACVYAGICIVKAPKINPKNIYDNISVGSTLYDDKGKQVDTVYMYENRKIAKYKDIPNNLKNAFIAIEDKTFWTHHGFNFKRMIGAVVKSVFGGSGISGTSTITQQLARNVYLADIKSQRSIKRKIIEMYYAYKIEKTLSKQEILEAYLNSIYLGYGCYGVNSASKAYYSKDIKDLTLAQCASLAALPQAPDTYALLKQEKDENCTKIKDGLYANDTSRDRRYLDLDLMVDQDMITSEKAEKAKKPIIKIIKPYDGKNSLSKITYFKDYIISSVADDLMEEYGMTEQEAINNVYARGLKIYSTLDSQAQDIITDEFKNKDNFPLDRKGNIPQSAMVITDVHDGAIKAMVGGRNPKGEKLFNRAINPRQPGSSIKPLAVYGAALQKSFELQEKGETWEYTNFGYDRQGTSGYGNYITTSSRVDDEMMTVNGKTWPYNAGGGFTGYNTFRTAIQQSINTCAVKILLQVGIDFSSEMLEKYGLTTIVTDQNEPSNDLNAAALALGGLTKGVTPLEMSLAYATFPNGGVRNEGYCYTKVLDRKGNVLLENKKKEHDVIDPGVAWIMTDVLKSNVTKGIAYNAAIDKVDVGGKTGTTNDQYDIWFDGFTPSYSASLWIGTDDNVSLTQMSGPAALLWGKIMKQIPKALMGEYLEMPENVIQSNGEYYTEGTEPYTQSVKTETKEKKENIDDTKEKDKKFD